MEVEAIKAHIAEPMEIVCRRWYSMLIGAIFDYFKVAGYFFQHEKRIC